MPGGASGGLLELLGASRVQQTLLGSNVKGSGISISVIFFIFLGFFIVLVSFGCLGELLGASLSFWEPPRSPKTGISFFVWLFLIVFLLGALESFWNKWVPSEGFCKAAYDHE